MKKYIKITYLVPHYNVDGFSVTQHETEVRDLMDFITPSSMWLDTVRRIATEGFVRMPRVKGEFDISAPLLSTVLSGQMSEAIP